MLSAGYWQDLCRSIFPAACRFLREIGSSVSKRLSEQFRSISVCSPMHLSISTFSFAVFSSVSIYSHFSLSFFTHNSISVAHYFFTWRVIQSPSQEPVPIIPKEFVFRPRGRGKDLRSDGRPSLNVLWSSEAVTLEHFSIDYWEKSIMNRLIKIFIY